jgi:hypothetical protein
MDFMAMFGAPAPSPMEKEPTGDTNEVRRVQTASPLPDMKWEDGMKTSEKIVGYDPIANPTDNPFQNKQGIGSAEYDYSSADDTMGSGMGGCCASDDDMDQQ